MSETTPDRQSEGPEDVARDITLQTTASSKVTGDYGLAVAASMGALRGHFGLAAAATNANAAVAGLSSTGLQSAFAAAAATNANAAIAGLSSMGLQSAFAAAAAAAATNANAAIAGLSSTGLQSAFAAAAATNANAAVAGLSSTGLQSAFAAAAATNANAAIVGLSSMGLQSAFAAAAATNAKGGIAGLSALHLDSYSSGFRASVLNALMAHVPDASHVRGEVPGFREAAFTMFGDLGVATVTAEDEVPFAPSLDDRAYEIISRGAPEVAVAVNMAAAKVRTPFWSRRAVRNALAWVLVAFVTTAYVAGAVLPQPWSWILSTLLGLSGASGPAAYTLIAPPPDGDPSPSVSQLS